jgi:hypothetical protein
MKLVLHLKGNRKLHKRLADRFVKARLVRPTNKYFTHDQGSYVNGNSHNTLVEAEMYQQKYPSRRIVLITWRGEWITIKKGKYES